MLYAEFYTLKWQILYVNYISIKKCECTNNGTQRNLTAQSYYCLASPFWLQPSKHTYKPKRFKIGTFSLKSKVPIVPYLQFVVLTPRFVMIFRWSCPAVFYSQICTYLAHSHMLSKISQAFTVLQSAYVGSIYILKKMCLFSHCCKKQSKTRQISHITLPYWFYQLSHKKCVTHNVFRIKDQRQVPHWRNLT